jgi:putrescine transport system ATP-binding protein
LRAVSTGRLSAGQRVTVAIRPEKFRISSASPADAARTWLAGEVTDIAYLGDMSLYKVRLDSGDMVKAASVNVTRLLERPIGWNERVWLTVAPDGAVVLTN